MVRFWNYARLNPGSSEPALGATVEVFDAGTLVLSTIYSDDGVTPQANPFVADSATAYFKWYAADGEYDVRLSGGGIVTPYTWGDISLVSQFDVTANHTFSGVDTFTGSLIVPNKTRATLPTPAVAGRIANVTDSVRGLWINSASGWQSTNGGYADVTAFGAVGDGSTSDLAAFQAAAAAAGVGGTVYIPPLTNGKFYNLGAGWLVQNLKGIRIIGGGPSAVIASTGASSDCLTLEGCPYYYLHGFTIQGVAGGRHGLVIGKSNNTNPSHYGTIDNVYIPPNVDGNGIRLQHGILTTIVDVKMSGNPLRPSVDAALTGGSWNPGYLLLTANIGIHALNQPSAQNNALAIRNPLIEGWGGHGIYADSIEGLIIDGNAVEGNFVGDASLYSKQAQITLVGRGNFTVTNVYTESASASAAANFWIENVTQGTVQDCVLSSVTATDGELTMINSSGVRLINLKGVTYSIDANCRDTVVDGVIYQSVSAGTFTNADPTARIERLKSGSSDYRAQGGVSQDTPQNLLTDPGLEQWLSTTPREWTSQNITVTRTGTGLADTVKFRGRSAARLDTITSATNGLYYAVADYADATTRAGLVNKKITLSAWVNVTAGTGVNFVVSYDGGAQVDGEGFTLASGWKKVSASFVIRSGYSSLSMRIVLGDAADVVYVDEVMIALADGSTTPSVTDGLVIGGQFGGNLVASSATPTFDALSSSCHRMTLTANVTSVTFANPVAGKPFYLIFVQDAGGGHTVTGWTVSGGSVRWAGGAAPVIAAGANARSLLSFVYDGVDIYEVSRTLGY